MPSSDREHVLVPLLLLLTFVTGLVDAVSVLGLGRVFTANMTGNVVFLGFAAAGSPGLSLIRSITALVAFFCGAVIGGRLGTHIDPGVNDRPVFIAFATEAILLLVAMGVAIGAGPDLADVATRLYPVIALMGLAMGIRNAVVRKLAVPDLTTTVLTLTITGLASDSSLAGGKRTRRGRRAAAVALILIGAMAGAWLVSHSVAMGLAVAGIVSGLCAIAAYRNLRAHKT
jgi:uncharacterized membrane protein YoaK (UPF0700 family)